MISSNSNDSVVDIKSNTYVVAHTSSDETKTTPIAASKPSRLRQACSTVFSEVNIAIAEAAQGVGTLTFSITSKLLASSPAGYALLTVAGAGIAGIIGGGSKTNELAADLARKANIKKTEDKLQENIQSKKRNRIFLNTLKTNLNALLGEVKILKTETRKTLDELPPPLISTKPRNKPTEDALKRSSTWQEEMRKGRGGPAAQALREKEAEEISKWESDEKEIKNEWDTFKQSTRDQIDSCGTESAEDLIPEDKESQIKLEKTTHYQYSFGDKCETLKTGAFSFFSAASPSYLITAAITSATGAAPAVAAIAGAAWGGRKTLNKIQALRKFKDEEKQIKDNEQESKTYQLLEEEDEKLRQILLDKQTKLTRDLQTLRLNGEKIKSRYQKAQTSPAENKGLPRPSSSSSSRTTPSASRLSPQIPSAFTTVTPNEVILDVRPAQRAKTEAAHETVITLSTPETSQRNSQTFFSSNSLNSRRTSQTSTASTAASTRKSAVKIKA